MQAGADLYSYTAAGGSPFHEPLFHFLNNRAIDVLYCTVIGRFCEAEALTRIVRRINDGRTGPRAVLILKTGLPPVGGLNPEYYGFGGLPEVRRLHVVSAENRDRFVQWQGGGEAVRRFVQVRREGVDLARFQPDLFDRNQARAKWDVAPDQLLVTCASRLHSAKGQDNLLLAAQQIVAARANVRFVIAGEGSELQRLEKLRDELGLHDYVRFPGHVERVAELLAASDVVCHPSLGDGLPNSVVEAMAVGLPVVASRVGGIPEVMEHGVSGFLIPPNDVLSLADHLGQLLDDVDLRGRLGRAAAAQIRTSLDFSAQAGEWERAVAQELTLFQTPEPEPAPAVVNRQTVHPILFLMTQMRTGGEETELSLIAKHLDRSRFRLSVASGWAVSEPSPAVERLARLQIPLDTACHGMASIEEKAAYLSSKIVTEKIRILVACQNTGLAYEVMRLLDPEQCRLIEHAGIAAEVRQIPKDRTHLLVGVSEHIAQEARPLFDDVSRVRYLPSMVDTTEFHRAERSVLRGAYGFNDDLIVLFAGRLDAKKGLDSLIDAAGVLLPEFPDARIIVAGPPDAYQADYAIRVIRRAASELPKDRFIFAGGRSDVAQLMCAADLLVLPSQGEGMSHVINEAGAAGLPVVALADGAASEQLENGAAGILVRPGDLQGLTDALRLLLSNPDLRKRMGSNLRQKVLRDYSVQQVMPRWHSLFEEAARGTSPVPAAPALRLVADDHRLPFPAEIQIETNTSCNATCIMCPYPEVSKELPPGRMDAALYEKLLNECAGEKTLWRIEPFLNNEPFTDTRMVDWIALAKQRVPHAMVTVTTNGSLLSKKVTDRLIGTGLDAIWFSFNGATKETYEHIMGLSFDLVKKNVDYLLDVKPANLRVFTNMIETLPMKGEIADNIRYWQSRGVQSGASPLANRAGNVKNFAELNYRRVSSHPVRICDLLYHKMYVGYNGDVLLCCMDWRRRIVLGNLRQQSIREVWQGEMYQHYRRLHEEGRSKELALCANCSYVAN